MASQSSVELQKNSTMDVGGLHENDESPPWMSQLFEKLDLEVDEEDLCSTDKIPKNDAHSIKKDDNSQMWGIGSFDKDRLEHMHPAVRALIPLQEKHMDSAGLSFVFLWKNEREKSVTDRDDYLSCHTLTTPGSGFESSACPLSSRALEAPHSSKMFRPCIGACYRASDEEAKEYYNTKKRLTYGRIRQNGMERLTEECLLAFRNYVQNISLEDTEHRFGELCCHSATIHVQGKIYQHFNFTIEIKVRNSDIWTSKLYFAEVMELSGVKYYFCCPLEASDRGDCYECEKQQFVDDLKHPSGGGYEKGYSINFDLCVGYYSSDSDTDRDKLSSSVSEDWLLYVN